MAKQTPIRQSQKMPWIRLIIILVALFLFITGGLLWILGEEHIIQGDWSSILPIIFTILGLILALCQWVFPFSSENAQIPAPSAPPSPTFEEVTRQMLLERAKNHYNAQRYTDAQLNYEKILELDPGCDEAYSYLAKLYLKSHSIEKAFTVIETVERLQGRYHERGTTANGFLPVADIFSAKQTYHATGKDLLLKSAGDSKPGIGKEDNEGYFFVGQDTVETEKTKEPFGLFVVADGMLGSATASRLVIQVIVEYLSAKLSSSNSMDNAALFELLRSGVLHANGALYEHNMEKSTNMGVTLTAAMIVGATAYVANVGDCRAYFFRGGQRLSKVTRDHAVVTSLVEAGIISPDDIYTHPRRGQVYRWLGEKAVVEVDVFQIALHPDDKLLLCSNGLWETVREPLMLYVMSTSLPDPSLLVEALIHAAHDKGSKGDISVIVVCIVDNTEIS